MPHIEYETFRYDLGPSDQRGVTKRFSALKKDLREILGGGVPGLGRESVDGRAIASFLAKHTLHPKYREDSTTIDTRIAQELHRITGYIS